jgi:hypothetical protein
MSAIAAKWGKKSRQFCPWPLFVIFEKDSAQQNANVS